MARYCFLLQARPERLEEYRTQHRAVWPDMLHALRDSGWRNYSIFARPDGLLVGYVEGGGPARDPSKALADVFWAILNGPEFKHNH